MKDYAELEKRLLSYADTLDEDAADFHVNEADEMEANCKEWAALQREARAAISELTKRCENARESVADIDLPALRKWLGEKCHAVAQIFPPQPISIENYLDAQRVIGALTHCLSRDLADDKGK